MKIPKGWQYEIQNRIKKGLCVSCGKNKTEYTQGKKPILKHLCSECEKRIIQKALSQFESEEKEK